MFCITIPAKNYKEIKKKIEKGRRYSDLFELRIDFLEKPEKEKIEEILKEPYRFIFTFRSHKEGGVKKVTDEDRLSFILWALKKEVFLVDVEYFFLKKYYQVFKKEKEFFEKLLVSYHNFSQTPSERKLKLMLKKMHGFGVKNAKIVTFCRRKEDWLRLLMLISYAKEIGISLVAFGMGEEGKLSRILCLLFGSPFTYVVLGKKEAVAPGQFDIKTALKIYNLLNRS